MSQKPEAPSTDGGHLSLRADCASCFGLCCVALPFAASADFAADKDAGQPCAHLQADFRCLVHADLRKRGFPGCTVFDCFGAGQQVSQTTFDGLDWRQAPHTAQHMFDVFSVMRQLHELLWYLAEALALPSARPIHRDLRHALNDTACLTRSSAETLAELDMAALRHDVNALLLRTSELVRAGIPGRKKNHRGADLIGSELKGADLRGANLRGARLIAADLKNADLRAADLIGVDFRDADLSGTDLTGSIFLTQSQLNAATGDTTPSCPRRSAAPRTGIPPHTARGRGRRAAVVRSDRSPQRRRAPAESTLLRQAVTTLHREGVDTGALVTLRSPTRTTCAHDGPDAGRHMRGVGS